MFNSRYMSPLDEGIIGFNPQSLSPSLWARADSGLGTPGDGQPVTTWTSREGNSREFTQATSSKRPLYVASAINGRPALDFDGTDDLLRASSAFLTGTEGAFFVVFELDADATQTLFGSADEATTTDFMWFARHVDDPFHVSNDGSGGSEVSTTSAVTTGVPHLMAVMSSGTAWTLRLDGAAETPVIIHASNNGNWFGDLTAPDSVTIGALKRTTEALFLNGKIAEILVLDTEPTAAQIASLENYFGKRYPSLGI